MDGRFVKGDGFLSKNMDKNNGKNTSESISGISRNFLIMPSNQLRIHLKLLQKEQFKKKQKQLVNGLEIKLLMKRGYSIFKKLV